MRFPTGSRALPLFPPLLASGLLACTFNIASRAFELTETSFGPFDTLHVDLTDIPAALDPAAIVVVGSERSDVEARAHLEALRSPGEPAEVVGAGWALLFGLRDVNALELNVVPPPRTDAWLENLVLDVPNSAALVLNVDSHALDVSRMRGRVDIEASSGSIDVETTGALNLRTSSGSVTARASDGVIEGDSGSVVFMLTGSAQATTTSGSIDGEMGDGGVVQTSSGSIDVVVTRALSRDLTVQSRSGSIDLTLPNAPCTLVVTSDHGDVVIRSGTFVEHSRSVHLDIAGGGPLVQVTNVSGSITIQTR